MKATLAHNYRDYLILPCSNRTHGGRWFVRVLPTLEPIRAPHYTTLSEARAGVDADLAKQEQSIVS